MQELPIQQLKNLSLKTELTGDGIPLTCLVIPSRAPYQDLARSIQKTVQACSGAQLPIRFDTEISPEEMRQTHVVALGNLADSRFIEILYYQWYTLVDRTYPGANGYVLHTVHDPWGTGKNVIVVGASDERGMEKAVAEFQRQLPVARTIALDRLHQVEFGANLQSLEDHLLRLADKPSEGDWGFGLQGKQIERCGLYYFISGLEVFAEWFREGFLSMAQAAPEQTPEIQVHLRFFTKVILWDLLEQAPVFTDGERLQITNYLLRVLRSEEGFENSRFQDVLEMEAPRQNHQTILALGLLFGGRYFDRYYHLPEAKQWLKAVDRLFAVCARHCKPACDCSDHGWRMTLPTVMLYAMAGGDMACFARGAIREAAERGIICCNNLGRMPAQGDSTPEAYPISLFAQAAHYYRDGRYAYMLRKHQATTSDPFCLLQDEFGEFERTFDSGVEPVEPQDMTGIRIAPLDGHYYEMPERYPAYARRLYGIPMPPANIPLDRTFDKISLRTGFSAADQYLLLDGTGGGNHSYEDANSIVEFSQYGKAFLVTEDSLHWPNFRDHNVVTVTRNGSGATSPSFAGLEHVYDFEKVGFLRTSLQNYNGIDWFRNILWVKGRYFAILDELVAREPGEYAFQCHWKMIGRPRLTEDAFAVSQGDEQAFLKNADHLRSWLEEVDIDLSTDYHEERTRLRKTQYGLDRLVAHALHQGIARPMEKGDKVVFHNLLYASSAQVPSTYQIRRLGSAWVEIAGSGPPAHLGAGAQDGALSTDARLFYIADNHLALAEGTYLGGDKTWFASRDPVSVEYSLAQGRGLLEARRATQVTLPAGGPDSVKLDGREVRLEGQEKNEGTWLLTFSAPAGRHSIEMAPPGERAISSLLTLSGEEHKPAPPSIPVLGTGAPAPFWTFENTAPITACHIRDVDADGHREIALGARDGHIHLLASDGSQRWTYSTAGQVNSICAADLDGDGLAEIVAGSDDCHIYALDSQGQVVWQYAPEFGYQHWAWWTQGQSRIKRVHVADLDGDGHPEIVAGVANMRLHVLDYQGRERWNYRTDHGLFTTFTTADLHRDGRREIIGGMAIKGSNSTCYVIGPEGEVQKTLINYGWTSQLTAIAVDDLDGDGRLEIACGTNRGDNLRVFDAESGALKWQHNLADPITNLIIYPASAGKLLVAGSASCYACAFDDRGEKVWACNLGSPVLLFSSSHPGGDRGPVLLAGCEDGSTWILGENGRKKSCLPPLDGKITVLWSGTLQAGAEPVLVIGSMRAGLGAWPVQELL